MRGFVWAGLVGLIAAACGGGTTAGEGARWAPGSEWHLEIVWAIGGSEAEGPASFGDVTGLAVDGGGRVWVLDRQSQHLTVFDTDGTFIRTVGRQGGGPGEFQGIYGVAIGPDQRVWVPDTRNARFTVLDTAGMTLGSYGRPANCYGYAWPGGVDAEGTVWDIVCGSTAGRSGSSLVRYDTADATYRDTTPVPHTAGAPGPPPYEFRSDRGSAMVGVPFTPGQVWSLNRDGTVWTGWTGAYVMTRRTMAGDTLVTIRHDAPRAPINSGEREEAVDRIERIARGSPWDAARIPDTHPAFARFVEDDGGYLWVQRRTTDGWAFDVFHPDGAFLGEVTPPDGVVLDPYLPITIRNDHMWLITRDAFNAAVLSRLRVVGRTGSR